MFKAKRVLLILPWVLFTFLFVPTRSFAASAPAPFSTAHPLFTTFEGVFTQGPGVEDPGVIPGSLTLKLDSQFHLSGNYTYLDGTKYPLRGQVSSHGDLTFTIVGPNNSLITCQGLLKLDRFEIVGTFDFALNGQSAGTGIWSAVFLPDPKKVLTLFFETEGRSGPDANAHYGGCWILNPASLQGVIQLPDGTYDQVHIQKDAQGNVQIVVGVGNGKWIRGPGHPISENGEHGYDGTFTGPAQGDTGVWFARYLLFSALE